MTKRSDMASRYAAAHARREQRRKQGPAREYLPLAEDAGLPIGSLAASAPLVADRGRGATVVAAGSRLPGIDYGYLRSDLVRTAILASCLFAIMIVLSFFVHA